MDLTKESIDKILGLIPPSTRVVEIGGKYYTYGKFELVHEPSVEGLNFRTLDSFADFTKLNFDKDSDVIVKVNSPTEVVLVDQIYGGDLNDYQTYARALGGDHVCNFNFGHRIDPERFIIELQTGFVQDEHRDLLIKTAGGLNSESESTVDDDGISQRTTVGKAVKSRTTIQNPVWLAPYRAFAEIEQVTSPFVFRIHDGPGLSLHEADCNAWKLTAMSRIKDYLTGLMPEFNVVA